MHPEERLLGFDAREMWLSFEELWSEEQKATYLLSENVVKPLSVGTMTWSPVLKDVDRSIKAQDWRTSLGQWDNPENLQTYLDIQSVGEKSYWVIGITLLYGILSEQEKQEHWYAFLPPTIPNTLDRDWLLLGYDVASGGLLSGLSNCGYRSEEIESLRGQWGPFLNKYHLFADTLQATEFATMTDERVPEHAPFFVYGLYLIEDNTQ